MDAQNTPFKTIKLQDYPQILIWSQPDGKISLKKHPFFVVEEKLKPLALAYLKGEQEAAKALLENFSMTSFEKTVLLELCRIPFGEKRTYGELAAKLGIPKGARAIGRACGKNPLPLFIPCHRVVGKGHLGGFLFGLKMKEELLQFENLAELS